MIVLLGLLIVILIGSIWYYYFKLLKRFYLIFKDNFDKKINYLLLILSLVLAIVTVNIFSIIGIFLFHFLVLSLIVDLIYFISDKCSRAFQQNNTIKKIHMSSVVPLMISLVILGYGFFNIHNVVEKEYTLYTEKELSEDLRVLLITDVHYETIFGRDKLEEYQKRLNEVKADIVVLGGDIVDESTTKAGMQEIFQMLGSVNNKYGIYYVTGNHDEQQYRANKQFTKSELDKEIEENNITIIDDDYVEINEDVVIAGRQDFSYGRRKSIEELLNDIDRDKYLIVVDHQPLDYDENMAYGTDLILSGHTHGGQVFPLSIFIRLLHTADLDYGHEKFGKMDAIVSSGMAGWGYPIRTERHSEYVVIDVVNK